MGYEVHITRRKDWANDTAEDAISEDQWLQYALADSSLRRVPANGSAFFELVNSKGWFNYSDGCIHSKKPNQSVLAKAHQIAATLRAKVQGDDGEVYLPNGETIGDEVQVVTRCPIWLFMLCMVSIGSFVVVILHILLGR